jgi:putative tricarboxylic transport membrane protein
MTRRFLRGEAIIAGGIVVLGVAMAFGTLAIPRSGGYERIGPAAYPWAISLFLVIIGAILAREAWRGAAPASAGNAGAGPSGFALRPFALVNLGLVLHLLLIERAGFVIASMTLFFCTARAMGARHWSVTTAIAFALSLAVYFAFSVGLDLALPAGTLLERP